MVKNIKENYRVYIHIFPNQKTYIGITRQTVEKRWRNGLGYKNQPIYNQIKKYGWDNIKHIVLYENLSRQEAQLKEIELIQEYDSINNGYNISFGGGLGSDCWCEFEYNGIIYTAKELAEMSPYDLTYHDITNRINEHRWTIDKAINTPKGRRNVMFQYNGGMYSIKELYEMRQDKNLTYKQIKTRLLKHNWNVERALTQPNDTKLQPSGVGTCLFEYKGKKYNSYELCKLSNVNDLKPVDITTRINKHGWTVHRAITQPKRKR